MGMGECGRAKMKRSHREPWLCKIQCGGTQRAHRQRKRLGEQRETCRAPRTRLDVRERQRRQTLKRANAMEKIQSATLGGETHAGQNVPLSLSHSSFLYLTPGGPVPTGKTMPDERKRGEEETG